MKKLLVDGFTTKIACPTGSFRVLVCPSGVDVSTSTLRYPSACLRTRRRATGTQRPDALYADRGYDHDKYRKCVLCADVAVWAAGWDELHERRGWFGVDGGTLTYLRGLLAGLECADSR